MKCHRFLGQTDPYCITFETSELTGYKEYIVAANAMSLTPYDQDRLELLDSQIDTFDFIGSVIAACGESDKPNITLSLEEVRYLGAGLLYYAETTDEDVNRFMINNLTSKRVFAVRREEGRVAYRMISQIDKRITIPTLWKPERFSFVPWHESIK